MSLQGPLIVVTERGAAGLVSALSEAGAFPIVETNWADAATAFVSVKPVAVVIAEPGAPASESAARLLCLQIATLQGPIVPTLAATAPDAEPAIPIAIPYDSTLPVERIVARLAATLRVRALHETVLRRIDGHAAQRDAMPALPIGDALNDALVLVAGRGPIYPLLTQAMGEQVRMIGSLTVENAARQLDIRDIHGIVVGDGFSPRMVDAFLTVLSQEPRLRAIPLTMIGEAPDGVASDTLDIDFIASPDHVAPRMVPRVRMHAFELRLKRMLQTLDSNGSLDPETGLHTVDAFWANLHRVMADAADRSQALSIARYTFDGIDDRATFDAARLAIKLLRPSDFATRDRDGALLVAFGQTDLRSAHVVSRRIAGSLKAAMPVASHGPAGVTANVTLATLKAGDTLDSLMMRLMGSRMVAAE